MYSWKKRRIAPLNKTGAKRARGHRGQGGKEGKGVKGQGQSEIMQHMYGMSGVAI